MDIGEAVKSMRDGRRVSREGWNGKGMYIMLVNGTEYPGGGKVLPFTQMFTAQGDYVPWLCSQTDLLANDWGVVE